MKSKLFKAMLLSCYVVSTCTIFTGRAQASEFEFDIGGYVREHLSFNLNDQPETKQNDRFDLSMARSTVQIEASVKKDDVRFCLIGRANGEIKTDYLKRLEKLGANSGSDLMDNYKDVELREAYLEFKPSDNLMLRLGKQQIVWGESDFFQAMDVVHGFDYTWRSFLEGENEDYRKPLILLNAMLDVPNVGGNLQAFIRPGLDREEDIGNTYDLFGGRWALQPNKGFDFLPVVPYNLDHQEGDASDVTGGIRWAGLLGKVNYSLSWLRSFGPDPVVNSAFVPYKEAPKGALGDFIFPKIDQFGVTASYAVSPPFDAVLSAEIAYIDGRAFNVGSDFLGGALPGFGGVIRKDTVRSMVRMDMPLDLTRQLGTNKPSFFTVQLFDTWITDYDKKDDIVDLAGYGATKKEHSTLVTAVLGLNYMSDRVNPQIAAGYDITYGGGFVIPSVAFAFGDKWRLNIEADLFFPTDSKKPGEIEKDTHLIGWFDNLSQLSTRLTYQF